MSDQLLDMIQGITKAQGYDILAAHNRELKEIKALLMDALKLAMRQLDDPDEDINAVRQQAEKALRRAEGRI